MTRRTRSSRFPSGWFTSHSASVESRQASRMPAHCGEPRGGDDGSMSNPRSADTQGFAAVYTPAAALSAGPRRLCTSPPLRAAMAAPSPRKQGWLMKRSVSAPGWRKNWRRRWLVLMEDGICWHRDEGLFNPVGELRFEPGATMRRVDADGPMLSIACAGRELVLKGSAPEVQAHGSTTSTHVRLVTAPTQHALLTPCCRSMRGKRQCAVRWPITRTRSDRPTRAPTGPAARR